jgi:hypothetical protein
MLGIHGTPDINRNFALMSAIGLCNDSSGGKAGGKSYDSPATMLMDASTIDNLSASAWTNKLGISDSAW